MSTRERADWYSMIQNSIDNTEATPTQKEQVRQLSSYVENAPFLHFEDAARALYSIFGIVY